MCHVVCSNAHYWLEFIAGYTHCSVFFYSHYYYSSCCKFRVSQDDVACCNQSCTSSVSGDFTAELVFDLFIKLADHTGSVDGVRLNGQAAIDLLHIMVNYCYYCCIMLNYYVSSPFTYCTPIFLPLLPMT